MQNAQQLFVRLSEVEKDTFRRANDDTLPILWQTHRHEFDEAISGNEIMVEVKKLCDEDFDKRA